MCILLDRLSGEEMHEEVHLGRARIWREHEHEAVINVAFHTNGCAYGPGISIGFRIRIGLVQGGVLVGVGANDEACRFLIGVDRRERRRHACIWRGVVIAQPCLLLFQPGIGTEAAIMEDGEAAPEAMRCGILREGPARRTR